jgi:predicted nuclease with TOPRIM domain
MGKEIPIINADNRLSCKEKICGHCVVVCKNALADQLDNAKAMSEMLDKVEANTKRIIEDSEDLREQNKQLQSDNKRMLDMLKRMKSRLAEHRMNLPEYPRTSMGFVCSMESDCADFINDIERGDSNG